MPWCMGACTCSRARSGIDSVLVVDFSHEATNEVCARNAEGGRAGLRVLQADMGAGLELPDDQAPFDLVVDKVCALVAGGGARVVAGHTRSG